VIDGVMYVAAGSKLIAVNAATGAPVWTVQIDPPFPASGRGPTYADGRIYAYGRSTLYAVDAKTGKVVESFGNKGQLEVARAALQFKYGGKEQTGYEMGSSPAFHNGTLYVGLAQSEHHIPGGLVVAVDGRTGAIKWVFNTIPQGPADDGWEIANSTWRGGVRAGGGIWNPPAIDPELGLLYFNAGNPSPDYDGSARKGMNLFTNSIIALNLQTGKLAWYYQTIHHEIWDFDLVTGPILFDVTVGGRTIKGVGSANKNCFLYLWHRDTGQPINPMVETLVPTRTDVPGEEIWPTQPFPYTAKGVPMLPFCATYPIVADPELAKRVRPIYTPYSGDVYRLPRRVELRVDVVQPSDGIALCHRQERRGGAVGETGRQYADSEHPVARPFRQHRRRAAASQGGGDHRLGNGDGVPPRHGGACVAGRTSNALEHRELRQSGHGRRSRASGKRYGRFLRVRCAFGRTALQLQGSARHSIESGHLSGERQAVHRHRGHEHDRRVGTAVAE
jgi:hypothetical protein